MMILLEGMHDSGKTTFANTWLSEYPDFSLVRGYCKTARDVVKFLDTYKDQNVIIDRLFIVPFARENQPIVAIDSVLDILQNTDNYLIKGYMFICDPDIAWEREYAKHRPHGDYISREEFDKIVDYSKTVYDHGIGFWELMDITEEY